MFRKDIDSAPLIEEMRVETQPVNQVAYSIGPVNIEKDDILKLKFKIEVVNDHKDAIPVHVGCFINSVSAKNEIERITSISENTVAPGAHLVVQAECGDEIEFNKSDCKFNFIVYAYTEKLQSDFCLQVRGAGFGEMTIHVVRHALVRRVEELQSQIENLQKQIIDLQVKLDEEQLSINMQEADIKQVRLLEEIEQVEISSLINQEKKIDEDIHKVADDLVRLEKTNSGNSLPSAASDGFFRRGPGF
jgi:hypothetical protein